MARRRKGHDEGDYSGSNWETTYADMMSLLLTFFILLFAYSTIDVQKFKEAVISLQAALGVLPGSPGVLDQFDLPAPQEPSQLGSLARQDQGLLKVMAKLDKYFKEKGLGDRVRLELESRGLVIRFTDTVLFDLGKAELKPDAKAVLAEIASILRTIGNEIIIEGNTDNIPLKDTAIYPTNWELSTARATTVLRYFVETTHLDPARFSAMGYGEYRPVVPNTSDENRARNRRVDIVVVREPQPVETSEGAGEAPADAQQSSSGTDVPSGENRVPTQERERQGGLE